MTAGNLEQDRQYTRTYNATLWRIRLTIVAMGNQHFFLCVLLSRRFHCLKYKNHFQSAPLEKKEYLFCIVEQLNAFNRIKVLVLSHKSNNGFPLHFCRATKYLLLLSTILVIYIYTGCPGGMCQTSGECSLR